MSEFSRNKRHVMANTEIGVLKEKEFNRYGVISVILLVVGCLGL